MEPIKHPQTARLRSLKMYREDLDHFLGFFQAKCARVTISEGPEPQVQSPRESVSTCPGERPLLPCT
jgi:hypothetical protein